MEIRKSGSTVLNVVQENKSADTENKAEKTLARGIASAKDSFEFAPNNTQENSGKKELDAAEQQEASKMNYKDFGNDNSSQDSRSRFDDARNSGLAALLGHTKEENDATTDRLPDGTTVDDLKNLNSPTGSEPTSDAVKDAQQRLNGRSNSRQSLDQELAQRRSDYSMLGGSSSIDRLRNSTPDPTAAPKGKGNVATGKDQLAYAVDSEHKNKDGSTTFVHDETGQLDGTTYVWHSEHTVDLHGPTVYKDKETAYTADNSKIEKETIRIFDKDQTKTTTTTTTTQQDGTVTINSSTKTNNKDGSTTTNTTETTTPAGGSRKMPGVDNRTGNIPEDIKKQIDYDIQQLRNAKPKSGGETALTDGGVTGNSVVDGGPINNAFTRAGGVMGMVGQPTRIGGEDIGNASGSAGGSAIHNGGATDPVDGSSWTGTTHQDDPADVQFGPKTPVAESVDSKKIDEDTDNSTDSSVLNQILNRKSKKAE